MPLPWTLEALQSTCSDSFRNMACRQVRWRMVTALDVCVHDQSQYRNYFFAVSVRPLTISALRGTQPHQPALMVSCAALLDRVGSGARGPTQASSAYSARAPRKINGKNALPPMSLHPSGPRKFDFWAGFELWLALPGSTSPKGEARPTPSKTKDTPTQSTVSKSSQASMLQRRSLSFLQPGGGISCGSAVEKTAPATAFPTARSS